MLSTRQRICLEGIGIRRWVERSTNGVAESSLPAESSGSDDSTVDIPVERPVAAESNLLPETRPTHENLARDLILDDWEQISRAITQCEACDLSQNCSQKVPGTGHHEAQLMIIGEGPGHDEDIHGEPFVGRSGQLLDKMLASIGIRRDQVFITNIVKCRPPNNRDPKQQEVAHCRLFLDAQIKLVSPRIILCVGRVSAHNLLGSNEPVGRLIERLHHLPGDDIPIKVTYHPAYLLRNPSAKAIAWNDMKQLYRILNA